MKKRIHNKKELRGHRRELRKNLTPAEAFLWKQLQNRKFEGRKFRRQHSIRDYIVDFYCPEEKIVIELDGNVHVNSTSEENDVKRDYELRQLGLTVLRFENKMVFDFLPSVLMEIRDHFKKK